MPTGAAEAPRPSVSPLPVLYSTTPPRVGYEYWRFWVGVEKGDGYLVTIDFAMMAPLSCSGEASVAANRLAQPQGAGPRLLGLRWPTRSLRDLGPPYREKCGLGGDRTILAGALHSAGDDAFSLERQSRSGET